MANLDSLPNELLARIVSFSDRRSLAQLRLTNKRFEDIAVGNLFERVTLYAHWANKTFEKWEEKSERDSQIPIRDPGANVSNDIYGNDSEGHVIRRNSVERSMRAMQEDEEDGFIAGSDEDEEEGFVAESYLQGEGRRDINPKSDRAKEDDDDGFVADSDMDQEHLSNVEGNELDLSRPRPHVESSRSPRPDLFRLSDFQAYEEQRQQKWDAIRPQWARDNFPGPPDYDAAVFLNIVENERLQKFVKEVQIYTCETHCVSRAIISEVDVD